MATQPLVEDHDESRFASMPLFDRTRALFDCVSSHDLETLKTICDDDFGIVDIAPDGGNVMIRTRDEWEGWFTTLFAQLTAMDAQTWTAIEDYQVLRGPELAYSVVEFRQYLSRRDLVAEFDCVVTIIWKQIDDGTWVESRWHCSVLDKRVPEGIEAP